MTFTLKYSISFLLIIFVLNVSYGQVYVNHAATGANNGTSWTDAYTDLKAAIEATSSGEIWVAQGTYYPDESNPGDQTLSFSMKNNVAIYGGFLGTEMNRSDRDWETNVTVMSGDLNNDDIVTGSGASLMITGNSENSFTVIDNSGLDNSAILDGFTIKRGSNCSVNGKGLSMHNENSDPIISNCTITENSCSMFYTQIAAVNNVNSSPIISNCIFSFNGGGALRFDSCTDPSISGCSFTDNYGDIGITAGISVLFNTNLTISDCSFERNSSINEGAGCILVNSSDATISDCIFKDNSGGFFSPGIHNFQSSPIIDNCVFNNNNSNSGFGEGGAISNSDGSNPTITNCSFINNSSPEGGAIWNGKNDLGGGSQSDPIITNCVFYENSAFEGAAIKTADGSPIVTNCTFSDNRLQNFSTDGIISGPGTFTNSIFWDNDNLFNGSGINTTYSIVEGGYSGTGNIDMDPLFNDPTDPDGPDDIPGTADDGIRIPTSSPGAGTGDPAIVTPPIDIAGIARGTVPFDMGAYVAGVPLPIPGDLVITEFLRNPFVVDDPFGEWFEVYNPTSADVDMAGMIIKNNGNFSHPIASSLVVPSEDYILIGRNADTNLNGGVSLDYVISNLILVNSGNGAIIIESDGVTIDSVGWDPSFPGAGDGQSANLKPDMLTHTANDNAANWCEPNATFGDGDKGTPGQENCCIQMVSITGGNSICVNETTTLSPTSGGTWTSSDDNIATVDNSGQVTAVAVGSATFTFTSDAGCFATTPSVTINLDDASFSYSAASYCKNSTDPIPTVTLPGGTFALNSTGLIMNTSSGEIDLEMSHVGTYTITYLTNGACPNSATTTLTIDAADDASFSYNASSYCKNGIDPTPTINGLSGGSFSSSSSELTINSSTGEIDLDMSDPGTYTITYLTNGTCPNSTSASLTIDAADDASFSYDAITYCVDDPYPTPTITLNGGMFSSTPNGLSINSSTGEIELDMSDVGTYTITYTTADICPNTSSVSVTVDENCICPDNMPNMFIGQDGNYENPNNWSLGCIPSIPISAQITIMEDLNVSSTTGLCVGPGGNFTITPGTTLNVDAPLLIENGGTIINNGILYNTSTITYQGIFTNTGTYKGSGNFIGNFNNNGILSIGN